MMNRYIKPFLYTILIAVSAFLLSGCTPSQDTIDSYNQLVGDAKTFQDAKEYSSAVNKYNEATSLIPSKLDAYNGIIDIFVTKNRLDDAKTIVDESANKLSANDRASLYLKIGNAYYSNKDYDKALTCFDLAKGIGDSSDSAQLGRAKVFIAKGNIEGAKDALNRNFSTDLKEETTLLSSYIKALTDTSSAKDLIANVDASEDWKSAYQSWSSVLTSLTNDDLFNAAKLSEEYINKGYPYLAISLLEPKKDSMAEYADGLYLLGKAYYEYGDYQKSIDTLVNITSLSSNLNQYIYWTMARDYYLLNDTNNAFDYYDRAITFAGDKAEEKLFQEYLDILMNNAQYTKAQEVLRTASTISDGDWVNIYYLRLSYLMDEPEKVTYYEGKISYDKLEDKFKREYLYWSAKSDIESNSLDNAKRTLDIFFTLDKFDPRYNLLMGQYYFQEGKLDEARTYLKKSIEYDTQRIVTDDAQKLLARID